MARKRKKSELSTAERKRKFIKDFRTYLIMSAFFVVLNVVGGSNHFWAIYPIAGWGIGVAIEYFSLYGPLKDPETEGIEKEFDLDYRRPKRRSRDVELREMDAPKGYREEDLV